MIITRTLDSKRYNNFLVLNDDTLYLCKEWVWKYYPRINLKIGKVYFILSTRPFDNAIEVSICKVSDRSISYFDTTNKFYRPIFHALMRDIHMLFLDKLELEEKKTIYVKVT